MKKKLRENMDISYKNPFDDYNANVLGPELIMQYWQTPFRMGSLKDFNETFFFTEKMPIVLQGSRGSGKTTILKYFSFPVQCERASNNNLSIKQQIIADAGVGFYLRCDDSFLNLFQIVFSEVIKEKWLICFEHYLELFFSSSILETIEKIGFETYEEENSFIRKLCLEKINSELCFNSIVEIREYLSNEIRYINKFRNNVLFTRETFAPKHIWGFYDLSGLLIDTIKKVIPGMKNINFLLLIDEFENLPIDLQKMFNNMIKFCKPGMSMRIGRRSENIVTKATVNDIEYLREENDYRLIILDYQAEDIKESRDYLLGIAEKRLEAFKEVDVPTDLLIILGEKQDLDKECAQVVKDKNKHLEYILNSNNRIATDSVLCEKIISIISYPENRIAESLAALWVARADKKQDLIEYAKYARDAMLAFIFKNEHEGREKFKSDYSNKYKHALAYVIYVAYKKDKLYYSFNTLCYLAEGNTRTFINLCKAIISDALFYEKEQFLNTGIISPESQNRAIRDYATSEFNSVCSIIQNGKDVRNLILGIGNVMSEYHKDRQIRYPETIQFTLNSENLSENAKKVLDIAESWALIKRKRVMQRVSAGISREDYLFFINRVFVPIFNISYRIRGGFNVVFTEEDVDKMILGINVSKINSEKKVKKTTKEDIYNDISQMSIFEEGDF